MPRPDPPARPPRERLIRSTVRLMRTQGVHGTGLREIVAAAEAPRGSLQHYFPGGKTQLISEAISYAGQVAAGRVAHHAAALTRPTPGDLFAALAGEWRDMYQQRGFAEGCPLAAATADTAAADSALRGVLGAALGIWQQALEAAVIDLGVPEARATPLAIVMISGLEGALILARSTGSTTPIDLVIEELRPLLDGFLPSTAQR